jgi:hypothetical protein
MAIVRNCIVRLLCALGPLVISGCTDDDQITRTLVAKQPVTEKSRSDEPASVQGHGNAGPHGLHHGMLAAVVPHKGRAWFFKVTGAQRIVARQSSAFVAFIKSVRFSGPEAPNPSWTLPDGWRQQPGSGMRYATLQIGTPEEPLELTVIPLRLPPDATMPEYVLSNINRWRGQLGLAPIGLPQLSDATRQFDLDEATATVVELVGVRKANGNRKHPDRPGEQSLR